MIIIPKSCFFVLEEMNWQPDRSLIFQVLPGTASLSSSSLGSESIDAKETLLFAMAQKQQAPWLLGSAVTSFVLGELECVSLSRQPGSPIIVRGLLFHYQIWVLDVSWPNSCQLTSCFSCKPYGLIFVRLSFSFCMTTHQPACVTYYYNFEPFLILFFVLYTISNTKYGKKQHIISSKRKRHAWASNFPLGKPTFKWPISRNIWRQSLSWPNWTWLS